MRRWASEPPAPNTGTQAGPVPSGAPTHSSPVWPCKWGAGAFLGGPASSALGTVPRHPSSRLWRERATCHVPQEQGWPKVAGRGAAEPRRGSRSPAFPLATRPGRAPAAPAGDSAPRLEQQDFHPGRPASLLLGSRQGLRQHLPGMQGAGAPGGQGPSAAQRGALGRPWVLLLTYLLASVDISCLFMQFSVLPYLSRSLGLDSVTFGYLQTSFGLLQLLGGPVLGRFADQRGARAAFTVSFLAASALYLLLTAACSPALPGVALLFASRLPALFMHILPAAQMVVADLSAPEERPAALGRLGLCFGVGVILGSLLGGTLSAAYGIQCPPFVAFVANLLGAVLSFTCIPASTKGAGAPGQAAPAGGPRAGVFDLKAISRLLLQPGVLPVFLVKVVSGFPSGLFMVMFSIISMDFFQLEAAQASYLTSFFGVLQMVVQGLVVGRLSSHFSEAALLRASVLVFAVVGLAMALMSNVFHFCLLMPGLVFSLCTLNVVTDSILTKAVSASDTGTMLGLCATVQPLTRTLGPTMGGLLYRSFGVSVFGHVQFAVNFLVLLVLWRQPLPHKTDKVW